MTRPELVGRRLWRIRSGILSASTSRRIPPRLESLARAQDASSRLGESGASPTETGETLATLRTDLDELEGEMTAFGAMDPEVVVSPFVSTIDNVNGIKIDFSHYYVPGVVALLVQHLALKLRRLSCVRTKGGSVELSGFAIDRRRSLIGKYIAYRLLGGLIARIDRQRVLGSDSRAPATDLVCRKGILY